MRLDSKRRGAGRDAASQASDRKPAPDEDSCELSHSVQPKHCVAAPEADAGQQRQLGAVEACSCVADIGLDSDPLDILQNLSAPGFAQKPCCTLFPGAEVTKDNRYELRRQVTPLGRGLPALHSKVRKYPLLGTAAGFTVQR